MKSNDPNQLHVFWDAPPMSPVTQPKPIADYERVRDKLEAAAAEGKSLIRLQPGYKRSPSEWSPWVIKQQTKNGAGGWRFKESYSDEQMAREAYQKLLDSGEYVEG